MPIIVLIKARFKFPIFKDWLSFLNNRYLPLSGETMDCIFCKIVKGEIPCTKLFENKDAMAFLDIMPVNKGHALVIPKNHFENIEDMPEEVLSEVMKAVKKVAPAVRKGVQAEGFNVQMNNGAVAGQVVFHAHLHIVPRFDNDGLKLWSGKKYKDGDQEDTRKRIVHFL
jgi:histidine triad (HIT) family protein